MKEGKDLDGSGWRPQTPRELAESEAKLYAAFWGQNPPGETRPAPDFTTVTQCQIVAGAWEYCQRIKAEYPGTAKAASAETYLRRTFATLQMDIAKCISDSVAAGPGAKRPEQSPTPQQKDPHGPAT